MVKSHEIHVTWGEQNKKNGFAVGLVISRLTEDFDHEELSSFTSEVKGCGGLE